MKLLLLSSIALFKYSMLRRIFPLILQFVFFWHHVTVFVTSFASIGTA